MWSFLLCSRVFFLVLSFWYASLTIPTRRRSATSDIRFSIHSTYVSLDFSDCTAAKPSISHNAFCGLQFVAAFELLMKKFLKESFSDWRRSPSSVAIDNGTKEIGYRKASWRVLLSGHLLPGDSFSFFLFHYLICFSLLG